MPIAHKKFEVRNAKSFKGGIHPKTFKSLSNQTASAYLSTPAKYQIPILQSIGNAQNVIVKIGQEVKSGEALTGSTIINHNELSLPVHAPCDGVITKIDTRYCGHPSSLPQRVVELTPLNPTKTGVQDKTPVTYGDLISTLSQDSEVLINKIRSAGIAGLGGATFPTYQKLKSCVEHAAQQQTAQNNTQKPTQLLVNAMECEPYITCDDRLLRESSRQILMGAIITAGIIKANTIIFAIEDNKPEATNSLKIAINDYFDEAKQTENSLAIELVIAPTKYPSGSEKQLIEIVTEKQLTNQSLPIDSGFLVQNVATLYAIFETIFLQKNLTQRLVTVTGNCLDNPGNYWIAFGTPISHIIETLNIDMTHCSEVIIGGPLMGQRITDFAIPVSKKVNCLIFNKNQTKPTQEHCIRCAECEKTCPMGLLPQQLYWHAETENWQAAEEHDLTICIECGACDYVCPSNIPLADYFRFAKSAIREKKSKEHNAQLAKERFERREARLVRQKQERKLKHQRAAEKRQKAADNKANDPDGKKAAIQAALLRVKSKKQNTD